MVHMTLENVGTVIAARELSLDDAQTIRVLIGTPKQRTDSNEWYCPYQTVGIGSGRVGISFGVDFVQALVLALSMVGAELYCSKEHEAGRLSWECGAVKGDLGFPVPESIRDVLPGNQGTNESQHG